MKLAAILLSVVGLVALLVATVPTVAQEPVVNRVKKISPVEPVDVDTELNNWQLSFESALEEDKAYIAAEAAVDTYERDTTEYDALVAVQEQAYIDTARIAYEQQFGPWQGSEAEFGRFVALASRTPLQQCGAAALSACGRGKVASVKVDGADCALTCQP